MKLKRISNVFHWSAKNIRTGGVFVGEIWAFWNASWCINSIHGKVEGIDRNKMGVSLKVSDCSR